MKKKKRTPKRTRHEANDGRKWHQKEGAYVNEKEAKRS